MSVTSILHSYYIPSFQASRGSIRQFGDTSLAAHVRDLLEFRKRGPAAGQENDKPEGFREMDR